MINDSEMTTAGLIKEAVAGSIVAMNIFHAITFMAMRDMAEANSGIEDLNFPNIYQ
jgi:hypothetical protein